MGSRYIKVVIPGKNFVMKQIKYILLVSVLAILALVMGCNKTKEAPEPPHVETALVVELLNALKAKDYSLAEKKLIRIESDETTDVYLEDILIRIKNNLLVSKAQKLLNDGKIDEAVECLQQKVSVEGENSSLVGALNDLIKLKDIDLLIDKIRKSKNSRDLALNTAKLKKIINTYPPAEILTEYSNKKLNHARTMLVREKELAVEDLKATIDTAWVEGRNYIDSMIADLDMIEVAYKNEILSGINKLGDSIVANKKETQNMFIRWIHWPSISFKEYGYGHDVSKLALEYSSRLYMADTLSKSIDTFKHYIKEIARYKYDSKYLSKEVIEAIKFVQRNYNSNISLKQVSKHVEISPNYLSSLFTKDLKMTFIEYINKIRIDKAKDMLMNTHLKAYEIAQNVGYNNESYFCRVFKKITGVRPSEYRKQWIADAEDDISVKED